MNFHNKHTRRIVAVVIVVIVVAMVATTLLPAMMIYTLKVERNVNEG